MTSSDIKYFCRIYSINSSCTVKVRLLQAYTKAFPKSGYFFLSNMKLFNTIMEVENIGGRSDLFHHEGD